MFTLTVPWWELIARVAIVYVALIVLVRVSGKRTVGQFTPFDLLMVVLLSEGVSNGMQGGEDSVAGALVIAVALVSLNLGVAFVTSRSQRVHDLIEGVPILIGRDGQLFDAVLRRNRVPAADVYQALREADCDLEDVRLAFLEADGKISILKKRD
ncbi:MAG: DUF421 domain-containing protein [Burkholderiales bacterium]|jgi:uncharacterized membrane protein YcaP (DUF421 family)|nr:DUF421 domain-containing protein [Burkholderiales bacterium]